MKAVAITAHQQAELIDVPDFQEPLKPNHLRGRTLVSLISSGTELNGPYAATAGFPLRLGYACVLEVEQVGSDVKGIQPGQHIFAPGNHAQHQEILSDWACPLPEGLMPEVAVYARLMGVSMSTLNTAAAHPPAHVLVTGLGPVGNLAAQIFHRCGYFVTASDPVEARCQVVRDAGIPDVRTELGDTAADLKGRISLHLECAGHEAAVLEGCRLIRRKGECVMVGVPWKKRADLQSFDILHAVFHNYVSLRSGWEWEIPRFETEFILHSIIENYQAALRWLHEGKIVVDKLGSGYSPADCQMVYSKLLDQSLPTPAAYFDWRKLG
jgi:threonine dehydrogenase-like Zn-dependent dehydrogenase